MTNNESQTLKYLLDNIWKQLNESDKQKAADLGTDHVCVSPVGGLPPIFNRGGALGKESMRESM